jgi:hypothetical protein
LGGLLWVKPASVTIPFDAFSVGLPHRREIMESLYNLVAGLDIHKKTVVVVVLQHAQPDQDYASSTFGTTQFGLKELAAFLRQHGVTHVAMESTAQYWRPVWMTLEEEFTLTLAQARSTRARRGRKWDKADARRIAKRLLSELCLETGDWEVLSVTRDAHNYQEFLLRPLGKPIGCANFRAPWMCDLEGIKSLTPKILLEKSEAEAGTRSEEEKLCAWLRANSITPSLGADL